VGDLVDQHSHAPRELSEYFQKYIIGTLYANVRQMTAYEDYADGTYDGVKDERVVRENAEAT
jgi:hypothetical protein